MPYTLSYIVYKLPAGAQRSLGSVASLNHKLIDRRLIGAVFCAYLGIMSPSSSAIDKNQESAQALRPCPESPNCASSYSQDPKRYVKPLPTGEAPRESFADLKKLVLDHPRVELVSERDDYMHFTFTTPVFRFVDDVEFFLDEKQAVIHMRSASRSGYYDFGVNKRRLERIRTRYSPAE